MLTGRTRTKTLNGKKVKLLASIGGWNMGGSAAGTPIIPKKPVTEPAWEILLDSPDAFAAAMSNIMQLNNDGQRLYDGIDIDIETLYGSGCLAEKCTSSDQSRAENGLVAAITRFHTENPGAILSISPRAADVYCQAKYCPWNDKQGIGFVGHILMKLQKNGIYFDDINPQFYNDEKERNLPNAISQDGTISYGNQIVDMLQHIHAMNIIGPQTAFNIGILAQTNNGQVDDGGTGVAFNPGLPRKLVKKLWTQLQNDKAIQATHIKINGFMIWAANIALNGTGIGGNVRSTHSPNNSVVPYDWGSSLFEKAKV